jgi:hypothetical protein
VPSGADELAGHVVYEQGDALYGRVEPDPGVEQLSDNAHFVKANRSGVCSYVLLRSDDHRQWLTVLECDPQGALKHLRTVLDEKLADATAILNAGYLPDGRLFIVLHSTPSLDIAVALDSQSNRTVMLGNSFTWDQSGKHIAYFFQPAGEPGEKAVAQLWMDGRKICDGPASETGDLSWDDMGTSLTATFPQAGQKDLNIVIRATDGVTIAQTSE